MLYKIKRHLNDLFSKEVKTPVIIKTSQDRILEGKRALITGGASGIGYAIAYCFVMSGANVVITGRDEKKLKTTCDKLNDLRMNSCEYVGLDMKECDKFEEKIREIVEKGSIDILVNNAGIRSKTIFNRIKIEEFDDVISTNLKGPVFLSQVVSEYMIQNGIKGNILNVSSSSSVRPANTAYTMSKWALRGFTIGMARELLPYGIVVNAVAPGPCATSMLGIDEESKDISWNANPSKRLVTPEEIAEVAKLLVSDAGRMIIGDTIYVTGGGAITTLDDVK